MPTSTPLAEPPIFDIDALETIVGAPLSSGHRPAADSVPALAALRRSLDPLAALIDGDEPVAASVFAVSPALPTADRSPRPLAGRRLVAATRPLARIAAVVFVAGLGAVGLLRRPDTPIARPAWSRLGALAPDWPPHRAEPRATTRRRDRSGRSRHVRHARHPHAGRTAVPRPVSVPSARRVTPPVGSARRPSAAHPSPSVVRRPARPQVPGARRPARATLTASFSTEFAP